MSYLKGFSKLLRNESYQMETMLMTWRFVMRTRKFLLARPLWFLEKGCAVIMALLMLCFWNIF